LKKSRSIVVGFLVAAAIPTVVFAIQVKTDYILGLLPMLLYFLTMAMAVLGLPAFLILRRFNLVRWWSALASGLAIGTLMAVLVRLPGSPRFDEMALSMTLSGAASGLAFFLIWNTSKPG
jgi:hypothetical protein